MTALGTSKGRAGQLLRWLAGAALMLSACAPAAPTSAPTAAPAKPAAAAPTAAPANPAAQPTTAPAKPAAQAPAATTAPVQSAVTAAPAQAAAKPAAADWQAKWNETLAAARNEREVVIYGPTGGNYRAVLVDAFQAAYPDIKVSYTGGGPDLAPRIITERQAGKFIPDLVVTGTTSLLTILKPAGALVPLEPLFIRPEVTDTSKWFGNQLWWADVDQRYDLMFEGGVSQVIAVNTTMVNPDTITSYWDLLDPKYKGKIVTSDIRRPGPGGGQSRFVWSTEGLGEPFLRKLFGEMDVTLSEDRRQIADWLAQGRYAIAFFPGTNEINEAMSQGLPLGYVDNRKLKEGFPVSAAFGSVVALDQRPHPNAASVYLNWLLGSDGQIAWQKAIGANSLRTDIPKDTVGADTVLPPTANKNTIFFSSLEKYQNIELTAIQKVITEAYEKKN